MNNNANIPNTRDNSKLMPFLDSKVTAWFEQAINDLKSDHMMLQTGTAPNEKLHIYNEVIHGDQINTIALMKETADKHFIKKILNDYQTVLNTYELNIIRLYMGFGPSNVHVWIEIKDEDEATLYNLLKVEAKTNALNYNYGVRIDSIIVEQGEHLKPPSDFFNAIN